LTLILPAPSTERLERSPLSLVVCQVRHERTLTASEPKRAVGIHDVVKENYPVLEEQAAQELTIAAGQLGLQTVPGAVNRGWKLRSNDQTWTTVIMPDFFSLETTRYVDWDDFRARLETFAHAVAEAVEPSLEQRVGLRFINWITHPDVKKPEDWIQRIDRSFLGIIAHERLGQAVATSQQVLQIDTGNGESITLRHGAVRDAESSGQMTYLIDQDCYVQRGKPFEVDQMLNAVEDLHTLILQIFQQAVTPELYQYLKG
jgi:uncharacterized protein (TIGR04255 family)